MVKVSPPLASAPWNWITILNRCHHFPGFVHQQARFSSDHKSIEIAVRPRKASAEICSRCHQPAPGYRAPFRVHSFLGLSGFSALFPCVASILEGNSRNIPYFMGKGFRRRRACRHLWAGASYSRPDRRHRSRRDPVRQRPQVSDAGLPDRPRPTISSDERIFAQNVRALPRAAIPQHAVAVVGIFGIRQAGDACGPHRHARDFRQRVVCQQQTSRP